MRLAPMMASLLVLAGCASTASVDVVDAARRQLIREGRAEGPLTDRMLDDPGPAVDKAVAEIFSKYPVAGATH